MPWRRAAPFLPVDGMVRMGNLESDSALPVGASGAISVTGVHDLAGNVAEWCNDIYAKDYYENSPSENPRGPADGDKYVLRGGAWNSSPELCRSSSRIGENPVFQDACFARDAIGFRCVRRVDKADTAGQQ